MQCRPKLKLSSSIKLIVSDFDGVFTNGQMYVDENFNYQKKISFKDIMGVSLALKNGYKVAIISGETSNILDYFYKKFGITEIHKGIRNKGEVLTNLMVKYGVKPGEVVYLGDDVNDISAFDCVDFKIAPPNANPYVKCLKGIQVTLSTGGDGAFREVIDTLIYPETAPDENEESGADDILTYEDD